MATRHCAWLFNASSLILINLNFTIYLQYLIPNTLSIKYPPRQLSTTLGQEYNAYNIAYCSVVTSISYRYHTVITKITTQEFITFNEVQSCVLDVTEPQFKCSKCIALCKD